MTRHAGKMPFPPADVADNEPRSEDARADLFDGWEKRLEMVRKQREQALAEREATPATPPVERPATARPRADTLETEGALSLDWAARVEQAARQRQKTLAEAARTGATPPRSRPRRMDVTPEPGPAAQPVEPARIRRAGPQPPRRGLDATRALRGMADGATPPDTMPPPRRGPRPAAGDALADDINGRDSLNADTVVPVTSLATDPAPLTRTADRPTRRKHPRTMLALVAVLVAGAVMLLPGRHPVEEQTATLTDQPAQPPVAVDPLPDPGPVALPAQDPATIDTGTDRPATPPVAPAAEPPVLTGEDVIASDVPPDPVVTEPGTPAFPGTAADAAPVGAVPFAALEVPMPAPDIGADAAVGPEPAAIQTPPTWSVATAASFAALDLPREDVGELQARLTALGLDSGGVDGILGSGTRSAISAWQAMSGIPVTGYLDRAQLNELIIQSQTAFAAWEQGTGNRASLDRLRQPSEPAKARTQLPRGYFWYEGRMCRRILGDVLYSCR